MKVFNGKSAAEDYMSSHTLTFSTPELTLMRFAFWLSDMIPDPKNPGQQMPRIMAFVEEKDFAPVAIIDEDRFVPTGAVKTIGGGFMEVSIPRQDLAQSSVLNAAQNFQQLLSSVQNVAQTKIDSRSCYHT